MKNIFIYYKYNIKKKKLLILKLKKIFKIYIKNKNFKFKIIKKEFKQFFLKKQ